MAIWLASYPDGGPRREGRSNQRRRRLPGESWLVDRLDDSPKVSTLANSELFLHRFGGGARRLPKAQQAEITVRGLARVGLSAAEHSHGWATRWSREARLLQEFWGLPDDSKSLSVTEVASCTSPNVLHRPVWVAVQVQL